jgi:drug/metabolite transporter (DMT)-like permease
VNGVKAKGGVFGKSTTNLALSALLLGAMTIGFAPILVRLSQVGPVATAFWRVALALPVLWLWMALEQQGATVFAWLILNEALGPWQALGGVIVLIGIFVARRGSRIGQT